MQVRLAFFRLKDAYAFENKESFRFFSSHDDGFRLIFITFVTQSE